MGKSASKSTKSELPQWYQEGAENLMNQAQMVGQLPYMPWMMPDVAAASPQLQNAWGMGNQWANAFGMGGMPGGGGFGGPAAGGGMAPGAQPVPGANPNFGGGHASFPLFNQNLAMLEMYYPGIMESYMAAVPASAMAVNIDPRTGQPFGGRKGPETQGPLTEEQAASEAAQAQQAKQDLDDRFRWEEIKDWGASGVSPVSGNLDRSAMADYQRLKEKFGN